MIRLQWLGQAGFLIETHEIRLVIDLFWTRRQGAARAPDFDLDRLGRIDWAFVTHEHRDHWDAPALQRLSTRCPTMRLVVPEPMRDAVLDAGFSGDRVITAVPDHRFSLGKTSTAIPVPSCHGVQVVDGYGFGLSGRQFLGYCFNLEGVVLYHSGDTICYPGMIEGLRRERVDVALLPINGRDFFREQQNIVGNLNPVEAGELAGQIGAHTFIPMHYDAIFANLGDVGSAAREARNRWPHLTVLLPGYGQAILLDARRPSAGGQLDECPEP